MTKNDVYDRLAILLKVPDSPSFNPVLEVLITPGEAALVLELNKATTCKELAGRLKMDGIILKAHLEELVNRGWLRSTKTGYIAPPMNPRFMPRIVLPGVSEEKDKEVWKNFFYQDWRRILVEDKERMLETKGYNQWRVAPSGKALAANPDIRPEQILPSEDVRDMARRATDITVHECGCRTAREQCDRPVVTCIRLVWSGEVDTSDEHTGGHENQEHISPERAIEIMDEAEQAGLVHTLLNAGRLEKSITICSCCTCCCYLLNPVIHYGKVHRLIDPSRFKPVIDEQKCSGCQSCVERCPFDAIEMKKVGGSKKMKPFVINEHCLGCGVCVLGCSDGAIKLELVRPPEHIPDRPMSQASSIPSRFEEA